MKSHFLRFSLFYSLRSFFFPKSLINQCCSAIKTECNVSKIVISFENIILLDLLLFAKISVKKKLKFFIVTSMQDIILWRWLKKLFLILYKQWSFEIIFSRNNFVEMFLKILFFACSMIPFTYFFVYFSFFLFSFSCPCQYSSTFQSVFSFIELDAL